MGAESLCGCAGATCAHAVPGPDLIASDPRSYVLTQAYNTDRFNAVSIPDFRSAEIRIKTTKMCFTGSVYRTFLFNTNSNSKTVTTNSFLPTSLGPLNLAKSPDIPQWIHGIQHP